MIIQYIYYFSSYTSILPEFINPLLHFKAGNDIKKEKNRDLHLTMFSSLDN